MLKYCGITIDLVNIHWLKDEWGDYWVAELFYGGKRFGLTGSYHSLNKEGTARLTREEQEAHIEENYKA